MEAEGSGNPHSEGLVGEVNHLSSEYLESERPEFRSWLCPVCQRWHYGHVTLPLCASLVPSVLVLL